MRTCPQCRLIYAEAVDHCGLDGARLIETDTDPLIGATIDRYKIIGPLGAGGMGRVYLAEHTVLSTRFALKVLYGDKAANRNTARRFEREAQAVSAMNHPNIVKMLDFATDETGLTYLVMELIDGRSLSQLIKAGPIAPERCRLIATEIAKGLGAAHAAGFVHRDLKPSNVMLSGSTDTVKILDFGIAAVIDSDDETSLTSTGATIGTPAYMAPEQAEGADVGPAADLYALGVIVFEMLSGTRPFSGPAGQMLVQKLSVPAPAVAPAGGLETVVASLLERDPSSRPTTAEAVVALLRTPGATQIATDAPTLEKSEPITLPQAPGRPRWLPALAFLLLFAVGGTWLAIREYNNSGEHGVHVEALTEPDAGENAARNSGTNTDPNTNRTVEVAAASKSAPILDAATATPTEPPPAAAKKRRPRKRASRTKPRAPRSSPVLDAGLAPVGQAPGQIRIVARHWFDVFVNGRHLYRHPKQAHPHPAGTFDLRLEATGCKTIERRVRIAPGKTTAVKATCTPP